MAFSRLVAPALACLVAAGCGGSGGSTPTSPAATPIPSAPPASTITVSGTAVDGLTGAGLAGVTLRMDGAADATTTADGAFTLAAGGSGATPRTVTLSSPAIVSRTTRLRVPGPDATLSLIPSSFDLAAFDQMFRSGGGALRRWTTPPGIVIQTRLLKFTNVSDPDYVALGETMTDGEATDLLADLAWALPQLTGGAFTSFASERRETVAEGDRVPISRPGFIVVNRVEGLTSAANYWGYTRWAWNAAGEVQGGFIMIDRDFDKSGSQYRRSLRAHEFGHALGYTHVTSRVSLMNSNARTEPNAFDKDGAKLAFQRPALNHTPDIDPAPFTGNLRAFQQLFWAGDR